MQAPHRVRRLRWQARAGDAAQAFALRALLRDRSEVVGEAVDRVLDAHVPRGEVWKLPRIELRLRAESVEALGENLAQWVAEALAESLRSLGRAGSDDASVGATADAAPAMRLRIAERERAVLLAYLASGQLDWTLAGLPAESARTRLRGAARSLADSPGDVVAAWPRALSRRELWLERWLALLPEQSHRTLVEALLRESGRSAALPAADGHAGATARLALARQLARATLAEPKTPVPLADAVRDVPMSPYRAPQPSIEDADRASSLLAPAAGLVLLHPFVPRLFAACKLVADERSDTIDDKQRPRAAALLHWLAHGDAHGEPLEFELPFVKLLLGLALDDALAPSGLQDGDRAEALALLRSVIEHWAALRNTGVDALRVNFLQRRGLLEARDGAWHLRLQTEAFDMLVGLLPWSIGFVRLPWMTRPLITDWPTP